MPAIHNYRITCTQEVSVRANNLIDAARIAHAAFKNGQNSDGSVPGLPPGIIGNPTRPAHVLNFSVEEL